MVVFEQEIVVGNLCGLHGRPSVKLVETARCFRADIKLVRDDVEVDCKYILDVMSLACPKGTKVKIKACGEDAEAAIAALSELVRDNFGEE
ncbi:MAG: HPr family phosphocarrier protein [Desulfobulbaceae bacterium]|nr:HPr family phosphocarrier protein [Desulfobulbaceae bacterium]HIJ78062.1 HPr family phosphocarrier protein [Deltaproteobacteria bacterium]